ncbi:MAG: type III PLP-dependent enzyme [Gammaproteobacteria bacterium]
MNTSMHLSIDSLYDGATARALVERHGSPLLVLDCDAVRAQYRALVAALPQVDLHYAIKALPHRAVIATLDEEGACFDIATSGEIEMLRALHINPRHTLHTHPIKRDRDIRDALRFGCTTFVVDNPEELKKFVRYRERVGLILRLGFRNPDASIDLSKKFGCAPEQAPFMLAQAAKLGLHIKGLSFHVGSQCGSPAAHVQAVRCCAEIIRRAHAQGTAQLSVLDIGGGFPASYDATTPALSEYCAPLYAALADLPNHVRVIAEPGRVLVASAMACIASVIGKAKRDGCTWYYLDDGIYGSFSGQLYEHLRYPLVTIPTSGDRHPSVLAGPTCDSIDIIAEDIALPELAIGDLVIGRMMGAYTMATASEFNSIPKTPILVVNGPAAETRKIAYIA